MGFKKYIIASFVFLMIVVLGTLYVNNNEFTVKIVELGINKTLPIYIWVILPALVLLGATIIHMIFYGTKGYLQRTTIKKEGKQNSPHIHITQLIGLRHNRNQKKI